MSSKIFKMINPTILMLEVWMKAFLHAFVSVQFIIQDLSSKLHVCVLEFVQIDEMC